LSKTVIKVREKYKKIICGWLLFYYIVDWCKVAKNKKRVFRHAEPQFSPQKNRWVSLRKTVISQTKQALSRPSVQFCPELVEFYNRVRTEFEREG
jgi:hypothetical protein